MCAQCGCEVSLDKKGRENGEKGQRSAPDSIVDGPTDATGTDD